MRYPTPEWLTEAWGKTLLALLDLAQLPFSTDLEPLFTAPDLIHYLQVEHTRLFINALPATPAPPYASAIQQGLFMHTAAEEALSFYRQCGFEPCDPAEPPDALTTELEFLGLICHDPTKEQQFLRRHFRPWFTLFHAKVLDEARLPFYPAVVSLIDFLTQEVQP